MKIIKLILKLGIWLTAIVFLVHVVLVGSLMFGPMMKSYFERKTFVSAEWKTHLDDRNPIKLQMVHNMLSRHQLIGMSIKDVDELLGKPPKSSYFRDYDYVYWLGPERNFAGIDSEWLGIKFHDGVVVEVKMLID